MKRYLFAFYAIFVFSFFSCSSQSKIVLNSPNNEVFIDFTIDKGTAKYSLIYRGKDIIKAVMASVGGQAIRIIPVNSAEN